MAEVEHITADNDSAIELSRTTKRVAFTDPIHSEIPPPPLTWPQRIECILATMPSCCVACMFWECCDDDDAGSSTVRKECIISGLERHWYKLSQGQTKRPVQHAQRIGTSKGLLVHFEIGAPRIATRPTLQRLCTTMRTSVLSVLTLVSVSHASPAPRSPPDDSSLLPRDHAKPYKGDLTYFGAPTGREMCGYECSGLFAAVHPAWFTVFSIPEKSYPEDPICGRKIMAWTAKGNVTLEACGMCDHCKKSTDLDVSPASFSMLGSVTERRISMEWKWL